MQSNERDLSLKMFIRSWILAWMAPWMFNAPKVVVFICGCFWWEVDEGLGVREVVEVVCW